MHEADQSAEAAGACSSSFLLLNGSLLRNFFPQNGITHFRDVRNKSMVYIFKTNKDKIVLISSGCHIWILDV